MGTAIGKLVEKEAIPLDALTAKKVGVDSFNILYQFLSSIRGQDGTPLTDSRGRITSHLTGLFYRTINLIQKDVKTVFVFDGKPSKLKEETRAERKRIRTDAKEKFEKAKKEGKDAEAKKFAQQASVLTEEMIKEAQELAKHMGLPVVNAPGEGEAQIAKMVEKGDLYGCVSQDFDALLFGTPILLRNITVSGKRKVPGKDFYVDVEPERIELKKTLEKLEIDRKKLVWLGILIGTDFNKKFPKVGPKTALNLVKSHDSFEEIVKETRHEPEFDYRKIEEIFLNPSFDKDYRMDFSSVDREKVREFLCEEHDFSAERVENALNRLQKKLDEKGEQSTLGRWT